MRLPAPGDRLRKLCYWFLIFLAGCFAGWVYEEIFYWITEGMLRNRGVLYGPWLPIYGVGGLLIYAMKPLKKYPPLLFLLCVAGSGVVEYAIGWAAIHFLELRLWDYRGLFWNINGLVCFRSVISFGVMGVVFHYLLEPFCAKLYAKAPAKAVRALCAALAALFVLDCILSAIFRTPITY